MSTSPPRHVAIVLAAGASRRLGFPKQLIKVEGQTLIRRATLAALETLPLHTLVVVGYEAQQIVNEVADLSIERVDCTDWAEGMGASLRAAATQAMKYRCEGALVVLCDQPALRASHLKALVEHWSLMPDKAVASAYAGTIGVPAVLPRSWFSELQALSGDQGARSLLSQRAKDVATIAAPELARDIDQASDLYPR